MSVSVINYKFLQVLLIQCEMKMKNLCEISVISTAYVAKLEKGNNTIKDVLKKTANTCIAFYSIMGSH